MSLPDIPNDRSTLRSRATIVVAVLAGLFFVLALFLLWRSQNTGRYTLTITGGDALGQRHQLARLLVAQGRARGLHLNVVETSGSRESMERVGLGTLDLALVQGGQVSSPEVRHVATLAVEPLHLLVRSELANQPGGIQILRGKRLSLSTAGSGTRTLALATLRFAGLEPGHDFLDEEWRYDALATTPPEKLPDGIFMVSLLPSQLVERLVRRYGYRLMELPYGGALSLRDYSAASISIPAFTYSVTPPVPSRELPTVGNRLILIANRQVPEAAVAALLDTLLKGEFRKQANLPDLDEKSIAAMPEMPLHSGANAFLVRDDPFLTAAKVQSMESLRSFLMSVALGLFFLWRWTRRRRLAGFETYLAKVTGLEKRALELERQPLLDIRELIELQSRLSDLKTEALERFGRGELKGEELMTGFLTHVSDVRSYLTRLTLYERGRIAEQAADSIPDSLQDARLREEWAEAMRNGGQEGETS